MPSWRSSQPSSLCNNRCQMQKKETASSSSLFLYSFRSLVAGSNSIMLDRFSPSCILLPKTIICFHSVISVLSRFSTDIEQTISRCYPNIKNNKMLQNKHFYLQQCKINHFLDVFHVVERQPFEVHFRNVGNILAVVVAQYQIRNAGTFGSEYLFLHAADGEHFAA